MTSRVREIQTQFPADGYVEWIGVRPARGVAVNSVQACELSREAGIIGDRFQGPQGAKRQVTLIQQEHLEVIARLLGHDRIDPGLTRRNLVVRGINLIALKGQHFQIGSAILQATGACAPCSKMEEALGAGGFNAMRGHGGITACVIQDGQIKVGDPVSYRHRDDS